MDGRRRAWAHLRRLGRVRGGWSVTGVALVLPVAIAVAGWGVAVPLSAAEAIEWPPPWALPIILVYVLVLGGPLGEELGWRGYALPELERRFGPVIATLLLSGISALWHAPLFLVPDAVQASLPVGIFAAQILATSFIYTWLVHRTPHSLVPVLAFHTSFNVAVGIVLLQPPDGPRIVPLVASLAVAASLALAASLAVVLAGTETFRSGAAALPRGSDPIEGAEAPSPS